MEHWPSVSGEFIVFENLLSDVSVGLALAVRKIELLNYGVSYKSRDLFWVKITKLKLNLRVKNA